MTGKWLEEPGKYAAICFNFENKKLWYDDKRKFGNINIYTDETSLQKCLSVLGPDILNDEISLDDFKDRFLKSKSRKCIAILMKNQNVIAGIGNYLVSEILYDAKIFPGKFAEKSICNITDEEFERLYYSTLKIVNESYEKGGYSPSDYLHPDGKKGDFETKVYGKNLDPLGNPVARQKFDKSLDQNIYWVPAVQTPPSTEKISVRPATKITTKSMATMKSNNNKVVKMSSRTKVSKINTAGR